MHALIEADGLSKRFGKVQALSELSLTLPPGQPVAILGPNGAGKTTFIRMVATLLQPDRGTLTVAGHDVVRQPMAVRRLIGLAGQSAAVEEMMTGRENLVMVARLYGQGRKAAAASANRILAQMHLERRRRPAGAHLFGGHAAASGSGGQPGGDAAAAAARRADHGPGPRQPQRGVGRHPGDEPGRNRHPADDAVPRRGRPPGGLDRHHRRRPGHRPGHARPAQVACRRRHDRVAHRRRAHPGREPPRCSPPWAGRNRPPTRPPGAARWPRPPAPGCCPLSSGRSTTRRWPWRTSRCAGPRSTRCSWP